LKIYHLATLVRALAPKFLKEKYVGCWFFCFEVAYARWSDEFVNKNRQKCSPARIL
jgi:hypothetical protein